MKFEPLPECHPKTLETAIARNDPEELAVAVLSAALYAPAALAEQIARAR